MQYFDLREYFEFSRFPIGPKHELSNSRPPLDEFTSNIKFLQAEESDLNKFRKKWLRWDSNSRPPPHESGALINWATEPYKWITIIENISLKDFWVHKQRNQQITNLTILPIANESLKINLK